MKNVNEMAAQGDVIFRKVHRVPTEAVEQRTKGDIIVAHSETGHHHVAVASERGAAAMFSMPSNPLVAYVKMTTSGHVDIVHQRPFDTHETLRLLCDEAETVWEIRRQREHTPEGWRMVMD